MSAVATIITTIASLVPPIAEAIGAAAGNREAGREGGELLGIAAHRLVALFGGDQAEAQRLDLRMTERIDSAVARGVDSVFGAPRPYRGPDDLRRALDEPATALPVTLPPETLPGDPPDLDEDPYPDE